MTTFKDFTEQMIGATISEIGATATIGGAEVACAWDRTLKGEIAVEGGLWEEYSGKVFVLRSALASIPQRGQKITVDGEQRIISGVMQSSLSAMVTIMLRNEQS